MTIGLGSGSAVRAIVTRLAEEWPDGPPIRAAVASTLTEEFARDAGIEVLEFEGEVPLDLAVDGADEVAPDLGLLKGGGAALLREKLLVGAARRFVVMAEARKAVTRLGETRGLPVEIVRFGWRDTARRLLDLVPSAPVRTYDDGEPVVTEEGHHLLDCELPADGDLHALGTAIKATLGVVEHGLFLDQADLVLLGHPDGGVDRLERGSRGPGPH